MIKAILIDDEISSLEMMQWLLTTYCPEVEIIGMCQSGEEGLKCIAQRTPDVVFLDIEMPRINGFDVLDKLRDISFEIVFVTAYDAFAVRAFRYAAFNYLLKPVDAEELQATVNRLLKKRSSPSKDQMDLLFQELLNKKAHSSRIALTTGDGLIFVETKDISYCKAESNYTNVMMISGQKIMVAKTLKEIDETLAGKDFFRVHNSFLINVNHISKFLRSDGGSVVMPDKIQIPISRSRRDDFFQLFSKF